MASTSEQAAAALERAEMRQSVELRQARSGEAEAKTQIQVLQDQAAQMSATLKACQDAEQRCKANADEHVEKCKALEVKVEKTQTQLAVAIEDGANAQEELRRVQLKEAAAHKQIQSIQAALECERAASTELSRTLDAVGSCRPEMAAVAICSEALVMGIEAEEDDGARGDVSNERTNSLAAAGARQVFRVGRARILAGDGIEAATGKPLGPVPISARVHISNTGAERWPATVVLAISGGASLGLPVLPVASVSPGETTEVEMDLNVPRCLEAGEQSTTWILRDAATGVPLGPELLFEVQWLAEN